MAYPSKRFIRTSHSHPLRVDALRIQAGWGRLGLTLCPGKRGPSASSYWWDRDLDIDIAALQAWGALAVLTLIEDHEFDLLKVHSLGDKVQQAGMAWFHAPIRDVNPPDDRFERLWPAIREDLLRRIHAGESVVIHCRGGLGRAGTVAALLLIAAGVTPLEAINRVRTVRPGAIETEQQHHYVVTQGQRLATRPVDPY